MKLEIKKEILLRSHARLRIASETIAALAPQKDDDDWVDTVYSIYLDGIWRAAEKTEEQARVTMEKIKRQYHFKPKTVTVYSEEI